MTDPDTISAEEAARIKGVTIQTIRRAIQPGDLARCRSGRRWLASRQRLEAWTPIGHRPKKAKRPYRWRQPPPDSAA